ncbi:acyl-CoA dehydrogenase [Streptomyces sp. CBMA152]|uniref:acyl-CoA dehydrogenase n=1 Tax=Streptomyces sp. CBMA152 TaxID=1896312 RepID=UPI0016600D1A|nr:acyl-CoA dehydrogenase [Streptomyces sp. CBMA152]MBD0742251.1 hypothetical protein [Streptomyces sp. CBMA152]
MRTLALSKVTTDTLADDAVTRCRAACGALGFFSENRLMDYQALTMAFRSAGGDNRLILLDAAWTMVTGPDYLPPRDKPGTSGWLALFRTRERLLHTQLTALATDVATVPGPFGFATWNNHTDLAHSLAEAHAARTTAEALWEEWCAPVAPASVLHDLYELHCLERTAAHADWYLAHELLSPHEVLALPGRTDEICRRLTEHADSLTDLLEVPPELLHGSLATDDYVRALAPGPWPAPLVPRS